MNNIGGLRGEVTVLSPRNEALRVGYCGITAYHGGRYPAGTALGFKAMSLASALMFPDGGAFERGRCSVETAFTGTGFRDAIEMVLRCGSLGLYCSDSDMPVPKEALPAPGGGKFFYRFRQDEGCAELTLKPGLVPKEFYDATEALSSGKAKSEEYCLFLRRVVEAALLPLPPSEIFDVARRETCEPPDSPPETAGDISRGFSLTLGDFGIFRAELGDAIAYHGGDSLCGVCLSWALARQWLSALGGADAEIPVPRREIFLETAAQGAGILDAFEFLFRTSGDGRTGELKSSVKAPEVLPGAGSFAFAISMGGGGRKIFALRENMVPRDYLRLCQRRIESPHTFADGETLKALREDFARSMLNEPEPFEVYEAGV